MVLFVGLYKRDPCLFYGPKGSRYFLLITEDGGLEITGIGITETYGPLCVPKSMVLCSSEFTITLVRTPSSNCNSDSISLMRKQ